MKKYFKKFGQSLKSNWLNFGELVTSLVIGIAILGFNVLLAGMPVLLALKILVPFSIEVHLLVGFLYALFGRKLPKWSVK